ncbi:MAG: two component transcriptional regulator, AraC family [Eubacterium sp.]|nr:two component transcriptional regulator, AraC family [Eubacterium sp.]
MFNLLIVDDEKLTREGLFENINWSGMNISEVYTAPDGKEALALMKNTRIDILLCDVKMPHMDGIELASNVRESYPECKIIFLSGYSDKEYLKSAISLKVESYIEKPIDISEITNVISETITQLKNANLKKQSDDLLLSGLVESFPLVNQEIALGLISPGLNYDTFRAKYSPLYFSWDNNSLFAVLCIHPDRKSLYSKNSKDLINVIYTFLESSSNPLPIDFFAGQTAGGDIVLLINNATGNALETMSSLLKEVITEKLQLSVTIGVSPLCHSLQELPLAYEQSCKAVLQSFYLGAGQIIAFKNDLRGKKLPVQYFENLNINLDSTLRAFSFLETEQFSDIENIKKHLYILYKNMMERTLNNNLLPFEEFDQYNLAEIRELILEGMRAFQTLGNDLYDLKIKEAIHFVLWNYNNCDLSVKTIADHVGLSQNYLCSLFKQNTNVTVNDFIIQVRMEKVKKLLKCTDLRLYEITEKVGITDPNYMSALFKRCCGQTPSQYRHSRPM